VSLLAHPERNVLITGRANSTFADVAKVLAVRLGRRVCDVQAEARKRRLLSLTAVFGGAHPSETAVYGEVLKDLAGRRNHVACLDFDSLVAIEGYRRLLGKFYVVVLLDEQDPADTEAEVASIGLRELECELQLNWHGFQARQLARVITHCLYG
jgi:hypothetical protein